MKKTIWTTVIVLISLYTYSQSVISNDRGNRVLLGIDNPISAAAENIDCDKLFLKTDNGRILISHTSCSYVWAPARLGIGTLTLYKIRRKDTIFYGSKMFRVISIPLVLKLYGSSNDSISVKKLSEVTGPIIYPDFEGTHCDINIKCSKYSILAKRGNETLFNIDNTGLTFTKEALEFLKILQKGDILLFFDFRSDYSDNRIPVLQQFVITE